MADHVAHSQAFAVAVRAWLRTGGRPGADAAAGGEGSAGSPGQRTGSLADIGSGAGVPGLVLAEQLPELAVTLVERREGRATWLDEAAGTLARNGTRLEVWCADLYDLAHGDARGRFDVVTARAFGSPVATAELGGALLRLGGVLVVSEPPDRPDRWDAVDLDGLGLVDEGLSAEGTAVEGTAAGGRAGGGGTAGEDRVGDDRAHPDRPRARFRLLVRRRPLAGTRPRRNPRS